MALHLVFVNDNDGLRTPPQFVDGVLVQNQYPLDHLVLGELKPGEDPAEKLEYFRKQIPTLGTYLGLYDYVPERDDRFRNCLRHDSVKVAVDMELACAQRLKELKAEHDAKQAEIIPLALTAFLAADEDARKKLADHRQAVADVLAKCQADVEGIKDPEQLAAYNPEWPVKPE